ncbi:hypothetical protein A1Q2_01905 [Trichosporon asahii var. asahii CBS 8904]|uniref:Bacteriophage T5 Orf172 DNA-binding domain-containing protein n=1 Tax=Trichosporon asahii var. asahii (strain CBS 8904) TaxID=1220162 RepID=K1VWP5_TRIAC|nr:hypothetical protein A1Q2_01905 [Trichosporon asahii var. asahii CBS 8904]
MPSETSPLISPTPTSNGVGNTHAAPQRTYTNGDREVEVWKPGKSGFCGSILYHPLILIPPPTHLSTYLGPFPTPSLPTCVPSKPVEQLNPLSERKYGSGLPTLTTLLYDLSQLSAVPCIGFSPLDQRLANTPDQRSHGRVHPREQRRREQAQEAKPRRTTQPDVGQLRGADDTDEGPPPNEHVRLGSGRGDSLDLTSPRSRLSYVSSGAGASTYTASAPRHSALSNPSNGSNGTAAAGSSGMPGAAANGPSSTPIGLGIDTTTATTPVHRANNSLSSESSRGSSDSMPTPPNGPSPLEQITPRLNRHQNKRSSISYSPSNSFSPTAAARSSLERLERNSLERADRRSSLGILLEGEPAPGPGTPNGHAELLHAIAASERRVAELRSALTAEEKSLATLRRQFSSAVAAEHETPPRRLKPRTPSISEPLAPLRALSPSSNSTLSSRPLTAPRTSGEGRSPDKAKQDGKEGPLATLKESMGSSNPAQDTIGVGALWSAMAQDAEETIQEGKRFWGQLMKSVTASPQGNTGKSQRPESHIGLPNPKVSLSGSSGSEIGLSRTASRNSAISSASSQNLSAQGMSRSEEASKAPRAQSDVGRPSPRNTAAASTVSAPSAASRSAASPSASRSVVSAPGSTPKRKPSSPAVSSPASPASPSKVRCSGYTRSGERCKRLVKAGAPGAALLDNDERYCKDHAGLLLKPSGFYSRRSPGSEGTWVEFKTYIPRALGEQTQALLRTTMEATLSISETPGFLYVYELRGMGAPSTSFFKVGRSDCVPRRIGQWAAQCSSHAPMLRDVFPLAEGGSTLPGAMRSAGQMAAASKRWERLVHLELADRAAAERPLAYRSLEGKCADCGAVHREIFPLASSEGYSVVVEAITRWEKFVRAIA